MCWPGAQARPSHSHNHNPAPSKSTPNLLLYGRSALRPRHAHTVGECWVRCRGGKWGAEAGGGHKVVFAPPTPTPGPVSTPLQPFSLAWTILWVVGRAGQSGRDKLNHGGGLRPVKVGASCWGACLGTASQSRGRGRIRCGPGHAPSHALVPIHGYPIRHFL